MSETTDTGTETVEEFRARAAGWLQSALPSWDEPVMDDHELQRRIFDAGFGGIAFPKEYGGAGLTLAHQMAFYDTAAEMRRQTPRGLMVSIGMLGPTLLDHGSHEVKLRFLPKLLRGDEVWMQLLSEPRGGSDMAGSTTRLTRDGDHYVLTGAKMWSTGAHEADYGLCLCRSDWDAPKHRGLSMIAVPLKGTKGVSIEQTRAADGMLGEFCQEFFDDVALPTDNLVGDENQGWAVAQTLLFHERNSVGNVGYGYMTGRGASRGSGDTKADPLAVAAAAARRGAGAAVTGKVADAYIESVVGALTSARIMTGMRVGTHKGQWGSLLKLQGSESGHRTLRTALAVLGADAVMWDGDEVRIDNPGTEWLRSRGSTIAGGTSEMQRNIVSERLLGLPREPSVEQGLPFNEVLRRLGKPSAPS